MNSGFYAEIELVGKIGKKTYTQPFNDMYGSTRKALDVEIKWLIDLVERENCCRKVVVKKVFKVKEINY